jgi:hypothetical protein
MRATVHLLAKIGQRPGGIAMAALLMQLSCTFATGAMAQCVCTENCAQCVGCPAQYTTPFPACDKCYAGSMDQGKMACTFTGQLASQPPGAKTPDGGFFSGLRLPGTQLNTMIRIHPGF